MRLVGLAAALTALVAALAGCGGSSPAKPAAIPLTGIEPSGRLAEPSDFELTDQDGQTVRLARTIGQNRLRGEGREMRLVAGRDLQRGGFDLDKIALGKPRAKTREDAVAGEQQRPAIRMEAGMPPGRRLVTHAKTASGWQPSRG